MKSDLPLFRPVLPSVRKCSVSRSFFYFIFYFFGGDQIDFQCSVSAVFSYDFKFRGVVHQVSKTHQFLKTLSFLIYYFYFIIFLFIYYCIFKFLYYCIFIFLNYFINLTNEIRLRRIPERIFVLI